jgi:hypothetical protein
LLKDIEAEISKSKTLDLELASLQNRVELLQNMLKDYDPCSSPSSTSTEQMEALRDLREARDRMNDILVLVGLFLAFEGDSLLMRALLD